LRAEERMWGNIVYGERVVEALSRGVWRPKKRDTIRVVCDGDCGVAATVRDWKSRRGLSLLHRGVCTGNNGHCY